MMKGASSTEKFASPPRGEEGNICPAATLLEELDRVRPLPRALLTDFPRIGGALRIDRRPLLDCGSGQPSPFHGGAGSRGSVLRQEEPARTAPPPGRTQERRCRSLRTGDPRDLS